MDAVVFNPTAFTVQTVFGGVESGRWRYIPDINKISTLLRSGRLVIAQAPEDPVLINPDARAAFEELRRNRNKNVRAKNSEVRDTKESEPKNDTETEA